MKVAVVCWRPYEVFNAIRIIKGKLLHKDCLFDLYIQDLPSLLKMKDSLQKTGIFRSIYVYVEKTQGHSTRVRIKRTINYLFPKIALRNDDVSGITHEYNDYDIVMASGWASYFVEMVNANPRAKVFMFEDGTATYFGDERPRMLKTHLIFYKIIDKIFHKGPFSVNVDRIYVNKKNIVDKLYEYSVYNMPPIDNDVLSVLKVALDFSEIDHYANKKIIYLSQTVTRNSNPEYDDMKMCNVLRNRINDVIIRPHPKWPFCPEGFDMDDSHNVWELVIPYLNDACLISEFSTAAFSPQLLYNRKFSVIFLYRIMCKNAEAIKRYDAMVDIFRKDNPNIYTPNTFEEYVDLVESLP